MKKKVLLSCILCIAVISSCEKDELKLPAEVKLAFEMDALKIQENTKAGQVFSVDEAYLVLSALEFDGKREEGEDYFFTSLFDEALHAEMHTGQASRNVSFDIPQGIYKLIDLNLMVGDETSPAVVLRGKFQRGPLEDVPVIFEYAFREEIKVRAMNKEGKRQVVLRKDIPGTATILLDVPSMFQLFNIGLLRNAEQFSYQGEETIIINNEKNTDIFNLLATRLDKSLQVIFE
ncbi:MAG: hypothetical protein RQ743_12630 [Bacteroidales bacterium]|nr:hypothetical protein [Bacteroidales bacterium]